MIPFCADSTLQMLDIGPLRTCRCMHKHHSVAMNESDEWMASSYAWWRLQRDIHSCSAWSRQRRGRTRLAARWNVKRSLCYMSGPFHTVKAASLWLAWTASVFPAAMWQHLCSLSTCVLLDFEVCPISLSFPASGLLLLSFGSLQTNWITVHSRQTHVGVLQRELVESAPHDFENRIFAFSDIFCQ